MVHKSRNHQVAKLSRQQSASGQLPINDNDPFQWAGSARSNTEHGLEDPSSISPPGQNHPLFRGQFSMRPLRRGFPAKDTTYRKAEMSSILEGQAICSTKRSSNKLGHQTTLLTSRFPCTQHLPYSSCLADPCCFAFGFLGSNHELPSRIQRSKRQPWMTWL